MILGEPRDRHKNPANSFNKTNNSVVYFVLQCFEHNSRGMYDVIAIDLRMYENGLISSLSLEYRDIVGGFQTVWNVTNL